MLCMHTDSWETNSFGTTNWYLYNFVSYIEQYSIKTIMYDEESVKKPEE